MSNGGCTGVGRRGDDVRNLSLSGAFELLADGRRRHLLCYLADRDGPVPFSQLVGAVIERETDVRTADGATETGFLGEEYRRITLSIQREHLSLLESHGVILYDRERQLIELADDTGPLDHLLEMVRRSDD